MEENENLKEFYKDINKILHSVEFLQSDIIYFSDDNSFPLFLRRLTVELADDVEAAILEKEVSLDKEMKSKMNRYFNVISESINYKIITNELAQLIKDVNRLISNWLKMALNSNILSGFCLDDVDADRFLNLIQKMDRIMDGSTTLQNLIEVVSKLIIKAEKLLAASPRAFDISRSYFEAVKKEMKDDISQ
jgi:hypothetical protein